MTKVIAPICPVCSDTGVIETGNNDHPCDCEAGLSALFNVAGIQNTITGAEWQKLFRATGVESPKRAYGVTFTVFLRGDSIQLFSVFEIMLSYLKHKLGQIEFWSEEGSRIDLAADQTHAWCEIRETPCNRVMADKGRLVGAISIRRQGVR